MKYHNLFVIFEKVAKFDNVVCCKQKVALYGLNNLLQHQQEIIFSFITLTLCHRILLDT